LTPHNKSSGTAPSGRPTPVANFQQLTLPKEHRPFVLCEDLGRAESACCACPTALTKKPARQLPFVKSCFANDSVTKRCRLFGSRADAPALLTPYPLYNLLTPYPLYNENRAFFPSKLSLLSGVVLVKCDHRTEYVIGCRMQCTLAYKMYGVIARSFLRSDRGPLWQSA